MGWTRKWTIDPPPMKSELPSCWKCAPLFSGAAIEPTNFAPGTIDQ